MRASACSDFIKNAGVANIPQVKVPHSISCYANLLPGISRKFVCGMNSPTWAFLGHRDHHRDQADHVTARNLPGQWQGGSVNTFWGEAELPPAYGEEQE